MQRSPVRQPSARVSDADGQSLQLWQDRQPRPSLAEKVVTGILVAAGIRVNGNRPGDIRVHDARFFGRALSHGSLGLGESYMDGWWDAEPLDEFFAKAQRAELWRRTPSAVSVWLALKGRLLNRQTPDKSAAVARRHYDLGNDLYEAMLDPWMQYTCAYWNGAATLDEAQENKLDLISRKLGFSAGMRVLELGGGFGGLARFLAERHGCEVVSYNISREQVEFARQWCNGLPVRFELKDYREAAQEREPFDRVVSIGLCEHVGYKNYRRFMEIAHRCLRAGGLFLLHTIDGNRSYTATDAFIDRYIFPNGMIPAIEQLGRAMEGLWVMEDWHNFGPDYDRTLLAWWDNFDRAWPRLRTAYGDRFYRLWKFYIMASAGSFRARQLQLWQMVLSKGDIPSYRPVRRP
ncbi:MAG TPA: cyclopropane fatty acyl phospholipid synthase [Bryobacteraceae bacterium]|nr:cyclopropane fatty acyl phospholipid synthase [Bryobacteraceae bacterium]